MCLYLPTELMNGVILHCGSISSIMASNHRFPNGLKWKAFVLSPKKKGKEREGNEKERKGRKFSFFLSIQ
jgi:hypothetical protein